MATELSGTDMLGMSDEDFAKLNEPAVTAEETQATETTTEAATTEAAAEAATTEAAAEGSTTDTTEETTEATETGGETTGSEASTEGETQATVTEGEAKTDASTTEAGTTDSGAAAETTGADKSQETKTEAPNYETFYQKVLATPLKANGKEIKLSSAEEVIQLMQMGANYTRKMQELAPARKVLMMLQNNDLLDESRISFLIDLEKGNPEAVKKLVKDKGIDVMDIDTESETAYTPGDNLVTDEEVGFRAVLDEVASSETGKETLSVINTTWDEASKKKLWDNPRVMSVVHQHREIKAEGDKSIYDLITTEVERRTALGQIPTGTPFLQAYTMVGDEMAAAALNNNGGTGGQTTEAGQAQTTQTESQVLATRAATPKSGVKDGDKASAASPTRSSPKPAAAKVNVLAMSDEEFMKQANILEGRV